QEQQNQATTQRNLVHRVAQNGAHQLTKETFLFSRCSLRRLGLRLGFFLSRGYSRCRGASFSRFCRFCRLGVSTRLFSCISTRYVRLARTRCIAAGRGRLGAFTIAFSSTGFRLLTGTRHCGSRIRAAFSHARLSVSTFTFPGLGAFAGLSRRFFCVSRLRSRGAFAGLSRRFFCVSRLRSRGGFTFSIGVRTCGTGLGTLTLSRERSSSFFLGHTLKFCQLAVLQLEQALQGLNLFLHILQATGQLFVFTTSRIQLFHGNGITGVCTASLFAITTG